MNEQNRNLSPGRELELVSAAVVAADDAAEAAMRKYAWERRGFLGRLVRTQRTGIGLAEQGCQGADEGLPYASRIAS